MGRLALLALAAAMCTPAWGQAPAGVDDSAVRARWKKLSAPEQRDVADALALSCTYLETFQQSLLRHILRAQEKDSGYWLLEEKPPVFDPREHAPAQAIERDWLAATSAIVRSARARVFAKVPESKLVSAWRYDYASKALVHTEDLKDPSRIFFNGLAGFAPDHDLCQALVERALDNGAQTTALAAFGHAYTDREGGIYPGITLYDAWASGAEMEMPDVDTLGIIHAVLNEWKKWVAPVPPSSHDDLYSELGRLFTAAHRHRGLRHALASVYVTGDAVLRDGYQASLVQLHALWDAHRSTPASLAAKLPDDRGWARFLEQWAKDCKRKPALRRAGETRRWTLSQDSAKVRTLALAALDEVAGIASPISKSAGRATDTKR